MITATIIGAHAHLIRVDEAIHEMPVASQRESRVRVRAAILNTLGDEAMRGYAEWFRFAVTSAAPKAEIPKVRGPLCDLAIAMSFIGIEYDGLVLGELSLNGDVRPVRGLIPALIEAREQGYTKAMIPSAQSHEAAYVSDIEILPVATLTDALAMHASIGPGYVGAHRIAPPLEDLQGNAKLAYDRAAVSVAKGKHVLLFGPPGAGKTMIARRLVRALPLLTPEEMLEIRSIQSASGLDVQPIVHRPFRAPHHTASEQALTGGGSPMRLGEVSLAHLGILMLDELPEFPRRALEGLTFAVRCGKAHNYDCMPAKPTIVAAMNPCPCAWAGHKDRVCSCTTDRLKAYIARVEPFVNALEMDVIAVGEFDPEILPQLGGSRRDGGKR